jgi:hypothetical protein
LLRRFTEADRKLAVAGFRQAGTVTGVVNFLNFTFSALLGPVFRARLVQMPEGNSEFALAHY